MKQSTVSTPMFPLSCARAYRSRDERTQENLERT